MKRHLSKARAQALQRLHANRGQATLDRVTQALNRMECGTTIVLNNPFRWLRRNLAIEAGIHPTTLSDSRNRSAGWDMLFKRFEALKERLDLPAAEIVRKRSELRCAVDRARRAEAETKLKEQALVEQAELITDLRAELEEFQTLGSSMKQLIEERNALLKERNLWEARYRSIDPSLERIPLATRFTSMQPHGPLGDRP